MKGWWKSQDGEPVGERLMEGRIARLERQNRRQRRALALLAAVLILLAAHVLIPSGVPEFDTVRVKRLEVISPAGRPAVIVDTDQTGGRIAIRYNKGGNPPPPAIYLSAAPEGGSIQMYEPGSNFYAIAVRVGPEGHGRVEVRAKNMRKGIEMAGTSSEDTGGELVLFNKEGKSAVRLGAEPGGKGYLRSGGVSD